MDRAPWGVVHEGDFFAWAARTHERFECAAGNPPFIRYQTFKGEVRGRALQLCADLGVKFSGLTASWTPFLVATANLLKPGGRMAFVVPAAIGHAPYAAPLLDYLVEHFDDVQITAIRLKLFPELSEDCWLLHAAGFGGRPRSSALPCSIISSRPRRPARPLRFRFVSGANRGTAVFARICCLETSVSSIGPPPQTRAQCVLATSPRSESDTSVARMNSSTCGRPKPTRGKSRTNSYIRQFETAGYCRPES